MNDNQVSTRTLILACNRSFLTDKRPLCGSFAFLFLFSICRGRSIRKYLKNSMEMGNA